MRRSLAARSLTLLTVLLYLALPGGVLAARACPHHDGVAAHHHGDVSAGETSHDTHGAAQSAGTSASESANCETCTCIGTCCAAQLAAFRTDAVTIDLDETRQAVPDVTSSIELSPSHLAPYFLPYAHAPPMSSIG